MISLTGNISGFITALLGVIISAGTIYLGYKIMEEEKEKYGNI